eukprot:TRINITY_DN30282_c0_g1_i1.p1 TRINITY_DN30282_c0_g1~~TRINITY_DN30282_c0_g1_i1.p1  ORF type:complete len:298 (+),score=43.94 TRINITY_DN30282_c0_g1_i1:40-894(+)
MGNAVKVLLAFSSQFWPPDFHDIVCEGGGFLPEMWITEYPDSDSATPVEDIPSPPPLGKYLITGFATGDTAARLSSLPSSSVISHSLAQLDEMFNSLPLSASPNGTSALSSSLSPQPFPTSSLPLEISSKGFVVPLKSALLSPITESTEFTKERGSNLRTPDASRSARPTELPCACFPSAGTCPPSCARCSPASHFFAGGLVMNWGAEEFSCGGYTHPSLGAPLGSREEVGRPVGDCVFFAGEATHPGVNPCVHAAMDTGERAAREVLVAMNKVEVERQTLSKL